METESGSTLLKPIDGADYNIAESYLSGALNGVGSVLKQKQVINAVMHSFTKIQGHFIGHVLIARDTMKRT